MLELKAPGAGDVSTALDQAVAYYAALECLLERGEWFGQLLGYSSPKPPLEATAVVQYSGAASRILRSCLGRLTESRASFPHLSLSALLYDWKPQEGGFRVVEELQG